MNKIFKFFENSVEEAGEWLNKITHPFTGEDPMMIVPYRGYCSTKRLFLKGRVLEDEAYFAGKSSHELSAILNSFKRFETDEIPFAEVSIRMADQTFKVRADHEGYFTVDTDWNPPQEALKNRWLRADLELTEPISGEEGAPKITSQGDVLLPSKQASYGIITDVDDTVLQTHVNSRLKLKMLYATFMQHAEKRLPMEGIVELFQAFAKGKGGQSENPIFYVSNSPWNLYDLLEQFMDIHELPKGPILLRDFGIRPSGEFSQHKFAAITNILDTYPNLPFIMLGDTASKDADFYLQFAEQYPGRIKAIYIRLTQNNKNARRVAALIEAKSDMNAVLIRSSAEMIEHAKGVGLL